MASLPDDAPPQFATAEFDGLTDDSHGLFIRGLLFGIGGALLGLALYTAVGIITGLEIGLVALAVGWLVGKSIVTGSKGRTGRRYQIAALVLTYVAVSLSAVPIAVYYFAFDPGFVAEQTQDNDDQARSGLPNATTASQGPVSKAEALTVDSAATGTPAATPRPGLDADAEPLDDATPIGVMAIAGPLIWFGLTSPFYGLTSGPSGAIGLLILGLALRIAWQVTGGRAAAVREVLAGPEGPGGPGDKPTTLNLGR